MAKTRTRILILLTLIGVIVGAVYAWNSLPHASRWERGYSQIEEGDSKRKLLEILGKPTEIKDCYSTMHSAPREIWEKCGEEYRYIAFMQEWCYVIDREGNVLTKWRSVSQ